MFFFLLYCRFPALFSFFPALIEHCPKVKKMFCFLISLASNQVTKYLPATIANDGIYEKIPMEKSTHIHIPKPKSGEGKRTATTGTISRIWIAERESGGWTERSLTTESNTVRLLFAHTHTHKYFPIFATAHNNWTKMCSRLVEMQRERFEI